MSFHPSTGLYVYTPTLPLKYPEAHVFLETISVAISTEPQSSQCLTALILNLEHVEYVDATGLQTLLATKDFLFKFTNRHIPIHFVSIKSQHMNRLIRVATYNPAADSATTPPSSNLTPPTEYISEGAYSPPPVMRRSRSSSIVRKPSLRNSGSSAEMSVDEQAVPPSPKLRRIPSRPSNPHLVPTEAGLGITTVPLRSRQYSNPRRPSIPSSSTLIHERKGSVESQSDSPASDSTKRTTPPPAPTLTRSASISSFLNKMRVKASEALGLSAASGQDDNPLKGSVADANELTKPVLKRSGSNSSFAAVDFSGGASAVDSEAMSHFPSGFAKGLKYFHASLEEAIVAATAGVP
ncbi:hypothetical protein HDU79_009800 [Rhizoclosmatium sp. JEL0117]|nr:hypothetical protein HDU79_009800 [Rhizoclosmatium sp. JEL0117]